MQEHEMDERYTLMERVIKYRKAAKKGELNTEQIQELMDLRTFNRENVNSN